jgi:hypothetical protein
MNSPDLKAGIPVNQIDGGKSGAGRAIFSGFRLEFPATLIQSRPLF